MGEHEARQRAYAAAQAAFGPLPLRDERNGRVHVDGRAVFLEFHDTVQSRARGTDIRRPFRTTTITVPLARRLPVILMVENRQLYVHIGRTPEVRTGDAEFDAAYSVFGSPTEVVAAALDADVRHWIHTMGANPPPGLEDSRVQSSWSTPGLESKNTPEDLLRAARAQIHIADAIVRTYDARYAQLRAEAGAEAADGWHAGAAAEVEQRARDRTRMRVVVFGVLGVAAVALLGVSLLIVLAASFAGC